MKIMENPGAPIITKENRCKFTKSKENQRNSKRITERQSKEKQRTSTNIDERNSYQHLLLSTFAGPAYRRKENQNTSKRFKEHPRRSKINQRIEEHRRTSTNIDGHPMKINNFYKRFLKLFSVAILAQAVLFRTSGGSLIDANFVTCDTAQGRLT